MDYVARWETKNDALGEVRHILRISPSPRLGWDYSAIYRDQKGEWAFLVYRSDNHSFLSVKRLKRELKRKFRCPKDTLFCEEAEETMSVLADGE